MSITYEELLYPRFPHKMGYNISLSDTCNGFHITHLANGFFTADIYFPYAPLDRIKVVDTCDNPLIAKASAMLKANPDVFRQWIAIMEKHVKKDGGLEQWIFDLSTTNA